MFLVSNQWRFIRGWLIGGVRGKLRGKLAAKIAKIVRYKYILNLPARAC